MEEVEVDPKPSGKLLDGDAGCAWGVWSIDAEIDQKNLFVKTFIWPLTWNCPFTNKFNHRCSLRMGSGGGLPQSSGRRKHRSKC